MHGSYIQDPPPSIGETWQQVGMTTKTHAHTHPHTHTLDIPVHTHQDTHTRNTTTHIHNLCSERISNHFLECLSNLGVSMTSAGTENVLTKICPCFGDIISESKQKCLPELLLSCRCYEVILERPYQSHYQVESNLLPSSAFQ